MNDFLNGFTSYFARPGVLTIAVSVYVLVLGIRKFVEMVWPTLRKTAGEMAPAPMYASKAGMWWNEVVLHVLPVVIGGLFGLIHSSFLQGPLDKWGDAVMFDCGIGWFSGTLYKGVMKALSSKLGINLDPASSP